MFTLELVGFTAPGYYVLILIVTCIFCFYQVRRRSTAPALPPGPKRWPIIGNIHQLYGQNPITTIDYWHKLYGPIISFKTGMRTVISINSHRLCQDLMTKRSSIYSSRPRMIIAGDHAGHGLNTALLPSGKQWETHRRAIERLLNTRSTTRYRILHDVESMQVVQELLHSNDFTKSFRRYSASLNFGLAYGRRLVDHGQREVREWEEQGEDIVSALTNVYFAIVELFPVLDYLPRCLAPWKRVGEAMHERSTRFYVENFMSAQASATWNWVQESRLSSDLWELPPKEVAYMFGSVVQAGVEALPKPLRVFVRAALHYPSFVQKAQEELDEVVGRNRLPSFEDIAQLPYLTAFINEVLRWQPVTPMGVPHVVTQDDTFMGYLIPKGAMIIGNAWSMALNDQTCADAYQFLPDRWLGADRLPFTVFGYGRRTCPGRQLSMDGLYIVISRILWAYNIEHSYEGCQSVASDPWEIDHKFTSEPTSFAAAFKIRSIHHQRIIEREWSSVQKDSHEVLGRIGR